jgi:hypothetical protein
MPLLIDAKITINAKFQKKKKKNKKKEKTEHTFGLVACNTAEKSP